MFFTLFASRLFSRPCATLFSSLLLTGRTAYSVFSTGTTFRARLVRCHPILPHTRGDPRRPSRLALFDWACSRTEGAWGQGAAWGRMMTSSNFGEFGELMRFRPRAIEIYLGVIPNESKEETEPLVPRQTASAGSARALTGSNADTQV